jgi:hypothetical protein
MRVEVWSKGDAELGQTTWRLGDFDFPAVPRAGEYIRLREGWRTLGVMSVVYRIYDDREAEVDIAIGWISPEEWSSP